MRRKPNKHYTKEEGFKLDPDDYFTYRNGVAYRLLRKHRMTHYEAWQIAAIPAFFLWAFRRPIAFFKRRKADRLIRRRLESNRESHSRG